MTVTPTIAISSSGKVELALAHASSNVSARTKIIEFRLAPAGEWERSRSILWILYVPTAESKWAGRMRRHFLSSLQRDVATSNSSQATRTYEELESHGATPVVAGALLVLGSTGADWFTEHGVPVEAAARERFELWRPANCPLCAQGVRLEEVASYPPPACVRQPALALTPLQRPLRDSSILNQDAPYNGGRPSGQP